MICLYGTILHSCLSHGVYPCFIYDQPWCKLVTKVSLRGTILLQNRSYGTHSTLYRGGETGIIFIGYLYKITSLKNKVQSTNFEAHFVDRKPLSSTFWWSQQIVFKFKCPTIALTVEITSSSDTVIRFSSSPTSGNVSFPQHLPFSSSGKTALTNSGENFNLRPLLQW